MSHMKVATTIDNPVVHYVRVQGGNGSAWLTECGKLMPLAAARDGPVTCRMCLKRRKA